MCKVYLSLMCLCLRHSPYTNHQGTDAVPTSSCQTSKSVAISWTVCCNSPTKRKYFFPPIWPFCLLSFSNKKEILFSSNLTLLSAVIFQQKGDAFFLQFDTFVCCHFPTKRRYFFPPIWQNEIHFFLQFDPWPYSWQHLICEGNKLSMRAFHKNGNCFVARSASNPSQTLIRNCITLASYVFQAVDAAHDLRNGSWNSPLVIQAALYGSIYLKVKGRYKTKIKILKYRLTLNTNERKWWQL